MHFFFFETAFECEMCQKRYRFRGDLTKHMQIHVGANIYTCDVCEEGFRYHAEFKRHSFSHCDSGDKDKDDAAENSRDCYV